MCLWARSYRYSVSIDSIIVQKLLPGHSLILLQKLAESAGFNFANTKFYSLLLDDSTSTDAANVDNELLLAVWFDKNGLEENK